ncbi:uncharacterized protein nid2a isoform X3 [Hemiscyllium ocellatum]|uniref:uncharacterized protein nid2a isoform X3 n=1 Tax=Hemiscyllium ocellatum TaxID=170820 RepID=UPI0029677091|nr:uncharacterized protein nid2a isoform X3 [Hemiscyllium ocellatum]
MQGRGLISLFKLHWLLSLVSAIEREEFFPFGPHTPDLTLQQGDDETSPVIQLKRPFVFYDTQFSHLYVGTNGIISTQDFPRETQYVDDGFPTDFPVIAPFLSDIDTSNDRGRIYYRQDDSSDVLGRAGREIRRGFPQSSFTPTNAFIATWENVAAYEEVSRSVASSDRFNTFQALLAFDESNTYAIFLYPEDGLQFFGTRPKESYNVQIELPARVGFSRGETGFFLWKSEGPYYSITSNEQSVKNLYQMGNSGTRGVWVFHIGGASSFNNVIPANIGGTPSREDSVVTLDSALSGPVQHNMLESEYTDNEDYKQYYEDDDEEEEYMPSVPTEAVDRIDGIPDNLPYPDGGIIPSYPEGYPEAGIVSSYPETGVLPSYPERQPEVMTESRYPVGYSEVESLLRIPLPVTHNRHIVSVEEDDEIGTGGFTYNTGTRETCARNQGQCSQHAYCADYSTGFCCHCHSGYYGNGRECLPEGVTQRVNGKVNGKLIVGANRMPVEFRNADLHAYVVVNDGRAFTAISQIPEVVGWAMQSLPIIGDLFGWLFAVEQPGFKNGFSIAGAKFIRNVDIIFYPGNEKLNIMQIAQGLDTQNYLSIATEIEGELPDIAQGATVQIQPYDELYHRSSSAITSTTYREYSVETRDGRTQTLRYQLRQNITYYDCEHAPRTTPASQQLNVDRIFVLYDESEKVVRYAMINQIGAARGNLRPDTVNPCQDGSHTCDPRAQCFAINEREHICKCAPGYEGDGKVCSDIDECADISTHECGEHTVCVNVAGSYGCDCQHGYRILENGNTCVPVDQCTEGLCHSHATCYDTPGSYVCRCNPGYEGDGTQCRPIESEPVSRTKTACEELRDEVEAEFSPRGPRPHFGMHVPQCDEQGNFRPLQCHSSTGQCWCVDALGREISGTRTLPGNNLPTCRHSEPIQHSKTACEQHRERLKTVLSGRGSPALTGIHIPECDDEGNFRPLQCHSSTGHCWCVYENGQEIPGTRTPPGTGQPQCGQPVTNERPKTLCEQHQERVHLGLTPLIGAYIPQCDEEGNFRPLQCHGSTGHCWCVDETGQEIPGTRTPPGTGQPQCGQPESTERPKTVCEQHRERLQAELNLRGSQPLIGAYIPECDEEGNFKPLQCHGSTGHCWCVDERGQEIPGTRTPPGTGQPQCGQPANNERPKTACEQHRERLQSEARGSHPIVGVHIPECDEEGNFKPVQCDSSTGYCWCVYENGQQIPGTRTPPGISQPQCGQPAINERVKTACEQYQERLQAELRLRGTLVGIHIPECDEEGNFRPLQCHGSTGHCWCVYENGQEIPETRTPPGTDPPRCGVPEINERSKTACEQHRERLQMELSLRGNQALVGIHIPECDEEGKFRSVQCHSSSGHCWCVYENGQEIPGTRTPPGSARPRCGLPASEHPKSACEEHRERIQTQLRLRGSQPLIGIHIPECDEEGNFRPLQCHSSTGHCWCVYENGQEIPGTRTPPGTDRPQCGQPATDERPKTICEQYRERLQAELNLRGSQPLVGAYIPECDEEGNFKPLQCHGSTGHCWCVDERGQEIPGTRTPPGTGQPQCGQSVPIERPKTSCEQYRERLQAELNLRGSQPLIGAYIPQCDEEGNFRPLQCHGSTGHCWCVDETGQEIPGTRTPPGTGQPQCGQPGPVERPKTICEQHRERLQAELSLRGSQPLIGAYIPECDEEGNFKPLQCDGSTGHCWCVDERGQEIPGTRTPPGTGQPQCGQPGPIERPKTACEQYRERLQAELNLRGLQTVVGVHIPECDQDGNFKPLQCHSGTGYCWCVDGRGQEIPDTRTPLGSDQPQCGQPEPFERTKTVCEQQRERLQAELNLRGSPARVGAYIPECDEEGNFKPLQCHGSTGHCWCVDERGQEIPGTRTPPGTGQPQCGQPERIDRPRTACEQYRERLQAELNLRGSQPLVGAYIPQCDEEGNFRPLQCDGSTGHCWCVDERGQEIPGTRTPPGTGQPQCGQPERIDRPRTACEQYRERLQAELNLRGLQVGVHIPECDEEGNFKPLQCHGSTGYCWCVDERGQEVPGTRTPPGTSQPQCGHPESIERPKTACEQHRERLQAEVNQHGSHFLGIHIPECDEQGNFRPLQCHGSTGYCWCVDERGQEIPGTRTPPGASQPQCGQPEPVEGPKTICEQHRDRLQAELNLRGSQPLIGAYIPECDEQGNFKPLQCHGSTGYCWCVDERGQEIPGTRTPPGSGQPQCGQPEPVEVPKTICEQHRERLQAELSLRGSQPFVGAYIPECDEQGNFKPLQCHGSTGYCWCVDERGQEIPGTRTPPGSGQPQCGQSEPVEGPKTICEQHRERLQAELSLRGSPPFVGAYIPECDEQGNFKPLQCHGSTGYCWCVDERGQEIPGTRTPPGSGHPQCGQPEHVERPKTICEQHRERLQAELSLRGSQPLIGAYIPECDEEGKFRPLQCHGSTGYCWCVDERGQEIPGTRTPPGTGQPQCGQPESIERPKTACEQHRERLQSEVNQHGSHFLGIHIPECDEQGNFRPLQCHGSTGYCWCVDERGQEIPGTRTPPGTSQPQCGQPELPQRQPTVCERWRLSLLEHYGGRPANDQYIPECNEFGEFSPLQCHGNSGYCWCVDKDGREIQGTRTEPGSPPACIPTVAPPITQPSPAPVVTAPRTGTFLLYAQGQHIGYLPLNGTQLNKEGAKSLLALHGSIVIGIDYDCRDKMVYWTDVSGRTINRASLEPGAEPETVINSDLISPEGLTIDYLHRNMFWTDSGLDKIEVAKLDGSERRVLVDTDLVNPRAIAVDSLNGNLYWTDWNREAPKIETSHVDGTNRRVLVSNDIGLPNGLTFDPFSSQLCWADAGTKDLECVFSDGTGRQVVQRGLNYPFSIVAYANHFYYTDWRRDGIIVVSKDNNQITDEYLPDQRSHLYGITVAYPRCPHGSK